MDARSPNPIGALVQFKKLEGDRISPPFNQWIANTRLLIRTERSVQHARAAFSRPTRTPTSREFRALVVCSVVCCGFYRSASECQSGTAVIVINLDVVDISNLYSERLYAYLGLT